MILIDKKTSKKYTANWKKLIDTENFKKINDHLNSGLSFKISREEYKLIKENNPDNIHYYFGLTDDDKFKILVIDNIADNPFLSELTKNKYVLEKELSNDIILPSITDSKGMGVEFEDSHWLLKSDSQARILNTDTNIKVLENKKSGTFLTETFKDVEINFSEALHRIFKWNMHSLDWFKMKAKVLSAKDHRKMHVFPLMVLPFKDLQGVFESNTNATYAYHFFGLKFNTKKSFQETLGVIKKMKDAKKDFIKLYMMDLMISDFVQKESTESSAMFDRSCFCIVDELDIEKEHLSLLPH